MLNFKSMLVYYYVLIVFLAIPQVFASPLFNHLWKSSKKSKLTSSESQVKKEHISLEGLPDEILDKVIQHLHVHDKSVLNLKQTSRTLRDVANRNHYGQFSKLGSPNEPLRHESPYCKELKSSPDNYKQVRIAHVTNEFYLDCGMKQNVYLMEHVEELTIYGRTDLPYYMRHLIPFHQAGYMVPLWFNLYNISTESFHGIDNGLSSLPSSSATYQKPRARYPHLRKLEIIGVRGQVNTLQLAIAADGISAQQRLENIRKIVESNLTNINHQDKNGNTPLHTCLMPDLYRYEKGSIIDTVECLRILVKAGANVNIFNHQGSTPLHLAASLSYAEPIRFLIEEANVDINTSTDRCLGNACSGDTPLHLAIIYPRRGQMTIDNMDLHNMNLLGARYMKLTGYNNAFRVWNNLLSDNENRELPQHVLFTHPMVNISKSNHYGETILHAAITTGNIVMFRNILRSPTISDIINTYDNGKETPLKRALDKKYIPFVQRLLSVPSIDINKSFQGNKTPLMLSIQNFPATTAVAEMLLEFNPNVCAKDSMGATVFSYLRRLTVVTPAHERLDHRLFLKYQAECTNTLFGGQFLKKMFSSKN